NELVAEAKSLPGQRIVPVTTTAYSAYPAPTSAAYYSKSAAYYSPPPPPAANFYSDAPPAAQSPSAANYFFSPATRKASPHSYSYESMNLPQYPGGSDSVMQAASASKISKAASMLSNRSRLSHQSLSMSSNEIFVGTQPGFSDNILYGGTFDNIVCGAPLSSYDTAISVKSKPPKIETLYDFLKFQSFDGSFLPSSKFYSWFGKKDFKDFEVIGVENEKMLCLALAMVYLEIILFETFKDECEMCYEKAKKALKKEVGDDEQKIIEILKNVKEWFEEIGNGKLIVNIYTENLKHKKQASSNHIVEVLESSVTQKILLNLVKVA
ncbi:434_t:CDS:2, partial [Racocetra fulgida]